MWRGLGDLDDDNDSTLSDTLIGPFGNRPISDRKISVASLDFDDVYRRNLTFTKDLETPKETLEQSSRSEVIFLFGSIWCIIMLIQK